MVLSAHAYQWGSVLALVSRRNLCRFNSTVCHFKEVVILIIIDNNFIDSQNC